MRRRKAQTSRPKSKSADIEKIKDLGPQECVVCRKERPGGQLTPLPYCWMVHTVDDDRYAKGYWMPLTCSDECRIEGGYNIWRGI